MDTEVAELRVVDLEEVPVIVAVRKLNRYQCSQLVFGRGYLFQLFVQNGIHLRDAEFQCCKIDVALGFVVQVDRSLSDAGRARNIVHGCIVESLRRKYLPRSLKNAACPELSNDILLRSHRSSHGSLLNDYPVS